MTELIKPVRFGILIGLFGIIFGIGWAFWLVLGHERIHTTLERQAQKGIAKHSIKLFEGEVPHSHTEEIDKMHAQDVQKTASQHNNPIFELSHTRLRRGHLHAMGLGIFTIALSLVLAFTSAPDKIKTTASILAGLGGIIYPFAWIVMGYKTPSLGPEGAEMFVTKIAGPGVLLILIGIFTTAVFIIKDIFNRS